MGAGRKLRIFIVDDDIFYLNLFNHMLEKLGYGEVFIFDSAREALDRVSMKPDVIFLDHYMEGMSGDSALKRFKMNLPSAKVVMISGQSENEFNLSFKSYGADGFIQKGPNAVDNINEFLQGLCNKRRWFLF